MHEPERWPVSNAETWWSWRDYLDRVEDLPNIATLKREADCEIARILEVCRGSVAAEKAVPDPGAGWERRWRALLMRSPSVPSRIRPTKRPSDTLRM